MKLNTILAAERVVRLDKEWNGEPFWFEVKEHSLTPAVMQSFQDMEKRPIEIAHGLAGIVTEWSIFVDEIGDFPPTAANLACVPVEFLSFLLESVAEVWQGNAQTPKKSSGSSALTASSKTKTAA
jgi:hypothetical protein